MEEVLVETFEDIYRSDIVSPSSLDERVKFNDIAKELGFENLILDREKNPDQTRIPRLNSFEYRVYKEVCPESVELCDYTEEMPIRVIEAIKIAKPMIPENWEFYVYKATSNPDPIILAKSYSWNDESILIARWGKELLDFPSLVNLAMESIIDKAKVKAIEAKAFIESFESDPKGFAKGVLNNSLHI